MTDAGTGRTLVRGGVLGRVGLYLARWHYFHTLDSLPPGGRLLEFGCGGTSAWIAARFQAVGLNLSATASREARLVYGAGVQGDVAHLPFRDRSFEYVASSFVLEHLLPDVAARAFREVGRVLIDGGAFVCLCDLECDHPMLAFFRRFYPDGYREAYVHVPGYYGLVREGAWRGLLTGNGFTTVSWQLVSRLSVLDHSPWVHLGASAKFPRPIRWLGRLSGKVAAMQMAAPLWGAMVVLLDRVCRPLLS